MANNDKRSFQMLVLITTPKLADKAATLFQKGALPIQYRLNAEGTASSDIMDMLGLGSVDKCILLSTIPQHFGEKILDMLHEELKLNTVNSGIAFTIPLTGASNLVLRLAQSIEGTAFDSNGKDESTMTEAKHTVVVAVVNRGFSEDVMNAARTAGARGGTVLHSRSIGSEEAGAWGLSVQEEKDIVLILAKAEAKVEIMRSITETCGVNSKAQGVVVSLPVDSVMGI